MRRRASGVAYRELQADAIAALTGTGIYYGAALGEGRSVRDQETRRGRPRPRASGDARGCRHLRPATRPDRPRTGSPDRSGDRMLRGMSDPAQLVDRLAALPKVGAMPRAELKWLAAHGELQVYEPGLVIAPKGRRIEHLWVILSGSMAVQVDRGVGPRLVTQWGAGEVSGMLPYSRMTGPPGDNYLEERSEILTLHERHFPEMVHRCPRFTAHTVHCMLDRARSFSASDLHDEKMVSLGKLAAGLAHELNNPASATVRGAKQLLGMLPEADAAARALGSAGLSDQVAAVVAQVRAECIAQSAGVVLTPIQRADREDEIAAWLARRGLDADRAQTLADVGLTVASLDRIAEVTAGDGLDAALRSIAAGCATHALVLDIEQAATRIHDLVAAVKRFTYMDTLAGPEPVDVGAGLRDTVRVLAAKARSKHAGISLDLQEGLPRAHASGSELNQVWLNLLDNALDAIPDGGHVAVSGRAELDRVVVRVVDDGPGIAPDVVSHIFDPFFTTKPPGEGTGLGLDIARRLVRRYHGDLAVESIPGRTEFRVSLAAVRPASGPEGPAATAARDA